VVSWADDGCRRQARQHTSVELSFKLSLRVCANQAHAQLSPRPAKPARASARPRADLLEVGLDLLGLAGGEVLAVDLKLDLAR